MSDLVKNDSHEAEAVARIPTQHRGKPKFEALVRIHAKRMQKLEDVLFDIAAQRVLSDDTVGEQLDVIGRVLGQGREGMSDDVYRRALHARLLVIRSHGLAEDIIAVCLAMLADGVAVLPEDMLVKLVPYYPGAVVVRLTGEIPTDATLLERLYRYLQETASAGVNIQLEWNPAGDANTFTWGSSTAGQRWGEGKWARAHGAT